VPAASATFAFYQRRRTYGARLAPTSSLIFRFRRGEHAGDVKAQVRTRITAPAVGKVVIGVLVQDQPQVPFADDQHLVQALAAGGRDRHSAIASARVARTGVDDPHVGRGDHGVERGGELGIPVTDRELESVGVVLEVHQQATGLGGYPLTWGWTVIPARSTRGGGVLDEDQNSQAAREHGTGMEEVRSNDRRACPARNTRQVCPVRPGCGIELGIVENLPRRQDREPNEPSVLSTSSSALRRRSHLRNGSIGPQTLSMA